MPNYSQQPFSPQPKDAPRRLVKQAAAATVKTTDAKERAKCHVRSGGICEVITLSFRRHLPLRCPALATENHHLIGGSGRRNKGLSILAAHRLDVCKRCHQLLTGNVLVPIDGTLKEAAATVRYERIELPRKATR